MKAKIFTNQEEAGYLQQKKSSIFSPKTLNSESICMVGNQKVSHKQAASTCQTKKDGYAVATVDISAFDLSQPSFS